MISDGDMGNCVSQKNNEVKKSSQLHNSSANNIQSQDYNNEKKEQNVKQDDEAIIATADDAILAKLSTSERGYYSDPFLSHMSQHAAGIRNTATRTSQLQRKHHPIIHKGTHARVCTMDRSIKAFLSLPFSSHFRQIVILGAGKDTSYLRYQANLIIPSKTLPTETDDTNNTQTHVRWYEIDHPMVINTKSKLLDTLPPSIIPSSLVINVGMESKRGSILNSWAKSNSKINNSTSSLHLVPFDLRSSKNGLFQILIQDHNFSLDVPTLFLMECVQMYLPEFASRELLSSIAQSCRIALLSIYDPIASNSTRFGQMMQRNLQASGVITSDSSMIQNTTLEQQIQKIKDCGFELVVGCDMMDAYETVLTQNQRRKANLCEMLDELEEWILIMRHYGFIVAGVSKCSNINSEDEGKRFIRTFCSLGTNSPLGFDISKCKQVGEN